MGPAEGMDMCCRACGVRCLKKVLHTAESIAAETSIGWGHALGGNPSRIHEQSARCASTFACYFPIAHQLRVPRTRGGSFWPPTAHLPQAVDGRKIKPHGTPMHPRPPISRLEPPRRRTPRFGRNKSNPPEGAASSTNIETWGVGA